MAVKIGVSLIAWQNDDLPDLTADFTMEQALEEAREIGYTGVERGRRMPADTSGLRSCLHDAGVGLCGGWYSGNLLVNDVGTEIAAMRRQVEQFAALDAPCIVYGECSNTVQGEKDVPVNARPHLTREEIGSYGRKLSEVAKWCADRGVPLAYHQHMGSIVEAEADVDALMEGTSREVHLCFDTGHFLFGGADVLSLLDRWQDRVCHVHYKDIRPDVVDDVRGNNLSFLDAIIAGAFTVPGDGCIDFKAVTRRLKAMDYSGWIVVEAEQDPKKAPPYDYSKLGYDNIVAYCREAGLEIEPG